MTSPDDLSTAVELDAPVDEVTVEQAGEFGADDA